MRISFALKQKIKEICTKCKEVINIRRVSEDSKDLGLSFSEI